MDVLSCEVTLATAVNHQAMQSLLVRTNVSEAVGTRASREKEEWNGDGSKAGEKGRPKRH